MAITDLQLAVLIALSSGRRHGYAVVQDAQEILQRPSIPLTTVYSCFEVLEERELVRADGDEFVNGRARRYFRITAKGERLLEERASELARQVVTIRSRSVHRSSSGEAFA